MPNFDGTGPRNWFKRKRGFGLGPCGKGLARGNRWMDFSNYNSNIDEKKKVLNNELNEIEKEKQNIINELNKLN